MVIENAEQGTLWEMVGAEGKLDLTVPVPSFVRWAGSEKARPARHMCTFYTQAWDLAFGCVEGKPRRKRKERRYVQRTEIAFAFLHSRGGQQGRRKGRVDPNTTTEILRNH
ncbi:hypothetical protein NL676_006147 [Syzygium grande]|nr:hypothetical protein NL676_006147 [Syzygium grande]